MRIFNTYVFIGAGMWGWQLKFWRGLLKISSYLFFPWSFFSFFRAVARAEMLALLSLKCLCIAL